MTDKKNEDKKDGLKDFDIHIDPFGNITSNINIEKINKYLDHTVDDKKLSKLSEEE